MSKYPRSNTHARWRNVPPAAIPRLLALLNSELDPAGRLPSQAQVAILDDRKIILIEFDRDSVLLAFGLRADAAQTLGTLLTGPRLRPVSAADLRRVTWKPKARAT